ncbi:MAG: hypothetical protein H6953_11675 [Chromatiaceae bacterium]|nr:hypothetical protein [Chromatiaceae bacterium]MCP5315994.1 hypothetical protein [Chromatiaceae bacterium]
MNKIESSVDAMLAFHEIAGEVRAAIDSGNAIQDEHRETLETLSRYLDPESMALNAADALHILWEAHGNEQWPPTSERVKGALWTLREYLYLIARCSYARQDAEYMLSQDEKLSQPKRRRAEK